MQKQKIALPDGRYLIYYTFAEKGQQPKTDATNHKSQTSNPKCAGGKR